LQSPFAEKAKLASQTKASFVPVTRTHSRKSGTSDTAKCPFGSSHMVIEVLFVLGYSAFTSVHRFSVHQHQERWSQLE
jgi:hypothetical protein